MFQLKLVESEEGTHCGAAAMMVPGPDCHVLTELTWLLFSCDADQLTGPRAAFKQHGKYHLQTRSSIVN